MFVTHVIFEDISMSRGGYLPVELKAPCLIS